ncbi:hypothetical protein TVAG_487330 [Trichomonas vaginalis G3]|uniref:BEACH domain-containing protein n=1 Tax=Trichomonas vaginalis (strain ATCC PRA-98 / G3) TaxID=412133 RepID=A2EFL4_TRIV3|nr:hypothetical protein TVAG_487330 [Trichomonas vaginalis G3]|eukprot:XP_001320732.1 hypothetical protein [Trichomonas vaginalis G3]
MAQLLKFNKINQENVQQLEEKLKAGNHIDSIIAESLGKMQYSEELTKQIIHIHTKNKDIINFLAIRVYYNSIAFYQQFSPNFDEKLLMPLLSTLIFALDSDESLIAAKLYQFFFRILLQLPKFYEFDISINDLHTCIQALPSFKLIFYVLNQIIQSGCSTTSKFFAQILESFAVLLSEKPLNSSFNIIMILELLSKYLFALELPCLAFFGKVVPFVTEKNKLHDFVIRMTKEFLRQIKETNKLRINVVKKDTPILLPMQEPLLAFRDKIFTTDFEASKHPTIPEPLTYAHLTDENESILINHITNAFKDVKECYSLFLDMVIGEVSCNLESDFYFSLWNAVSEFALKSTQITKNKLTNNPVIVSSKIFYEGDTIFNQSKDFQKLNTLRDRVIQLYIEDPSNDYFIDFIKNITQYPLLMAETCLRFISKQTKTIELVCSKPQNTISLMESASVYQRIFFESNSDQIKTARDCLFILLKYLLHDDKFKCNIFTNKECTYGFLAFLFESNLADLTLTALKEYLMLPNVIDVSESVTTALVDDIKGITVYVPELQSLDLLIKILNTLNEVCTINNNLRMSFISICPLFTDIYNKLGKLDEFPPEQVKNIKDNQRLFMKCSLMFLALMSPYFSISEVQLAALELAIHNVSDDDLVFYNEILYHFMELLSGNYLSSNSCSFLIKSLEIPKYILKLYYKTPYFTNVLDNFKQLCSYSSTNIELLCTAGVDYALLELLEEAKCDPTAIPEQIDQILDLFFTICSSYSTNQTVLKFISLLSPIRSDEIEIDNSDAESRRSEFDFDSSHESVSVDSYLSSMHNDDSGNIMMSATEYINPYANYIAPKTNNNQDFLIPPPPREDSISNSFHRKHRFITQTKSELQLSLFPPPQPSDEQASVSTPLASESGSFEDASPLSTLNNSSEYSTEEKIISQQNFDDEEGKFEFEPSPKDELQIKIHQETARLSSSKKEIRNDVVLETIPEFVPIEMQDKTANKEKVPDLPQENPITTSDKSDKENPITTSDKSDKENPITTKEPVPAFPLVSTTKQPVPDLPPVNPVSQTTTKQPVPDLPPVKIDNPETTKQELTIEQQQDKAIEETLKDISAAESEKSEDKERGRKPRRRSSFSADRLEPHEPNPVEINLPSTSPLSTLNSKTQEIDLTDDGQEISISSEGSLQNPWGSYRSADASRRSSFTDYVSIAESASYHEVNNTPILDQAMNNNIELSPPSENMKVKVEVDENPRIKQYNSRNYLILDFMDKNYKYKEVDEKHKKSNFEVSPLFYSFLTAFHRIIDDSNENHVHYYALNKSIIECPFHEFPTIKEGLSFSFSCWLFLDNNPAEYRPYIFDFINGNSDIGCFITSKTACFVICKGETTHTSKLNAEFPLQKWFFFSVSIKSFTNRISVYSTIDLKEQETVNLPKIEFTDKATFFIRGGGYQKEVENPHKMSFPVLLNFMEPSEFAKIRSMSQKSTTVPNSIYIFNQERSLLEIIPQFMHTLIYNGLIPTLLPLFIYNDSNPSYFFESAISILSKIMKFSPKAQHSFIKYKGIESISYLLLTEWSDKFTPKMYSYFEDLLEIFSDKLKRPLFEKILTNFDIIVQMKEENQIKIYKSWANKLFVNYPELANKYCNVDRILSCLRTHYYYEDAEKDIIIQRKQQIDVTQIRKCLLVLIFKFAQNNFDYFFFEYLILCILTIKDDKQVDELMELTVSIINSNFCNFSFVTENYYERLFELFTVQNVKFNTFLIDILIGLQATGNYPSSFFLGFSKVLTSLFYSYSDSIEKLNRAVLKSLKTIPEFSSLACSLSVKCSDEKEMTKILHFINEESFTKIDKNSLMWLIVLVIKLEKPEDKNKMMSCICMAKEKWTEAFNFFEMISGRRNPKTYENQYLFLLTAANLLIDKKIYASKPTLENFFQLSQKYIMYRDQNEPNPCMEKLFKETYNERMDTTMDCNVLLKLRFDKNGEWLDNVLAKKIIELFLEFNVTKYTKFVLTLVGFIMRTKNPSIIYELTKMSLTEKERIENIEPITYYAYQCQRVSKMCYYAKVEVPKQGQFLYDFFEPICLSPFDNQSLNDLQNAFNEEQRKLYEKTQWLMSFDINNKIDKLNLRIKRFSLRSKSIQLEDGFHWQVLWNKLAVEGGLWASAKSDTFNNYRLNCSTFGGAFIKVGDKEINRRDVVQDTKESDKLASFPGMLILNGQRLPSYFELNRELIIVRTVSDTISLPLKELKNLFYTQVSLKVSRFEFTSYSGDSLLFEFTGIETSQIFISITSLKPPHMKHCMTRMNDEFNLSTKWAKGTISNFKYLSLLNSMVGRSFNTPENYPIFPLVYKNRDFTKLLRIPSTSNILQMLTNVRPFDGQKAYTQIDYNMETIPEYYCMPELYENVDENSLHFVYENRKLLESDFVSDLLNNWVTLMFPGLGNVPKKGSQATELKKYDITFSLGVKDIFVSNYCKGTFTLLGETSKLMKFVLDLEKIQDKVVLGEDFNLETQEMILPTNAKQILPVGKERFAFLRSKKPYLQIVDHLGTMNAPTASSSEVTCVSSKGNYIAVGTFNSEIIVFYDNVLKYSFPVYRDPFTSIDVSDTFGTICAATKESIALFSLATGNATLTIDLSGLRPKKVAISPKWGFIVVHGIRITERKEENAIAVYTINGKFVSEYYIEGSIHSWTLFSNKNDFDYICFNVDNNVYVAELIDVESIAEVCKEKDTIVSINYEKNISAIVYTTNTGNVHIISV